MHSFGYIAEQGLCPIHSLHVQSFSAFLALSTSRRSSSHHLSGRTECELKYRRQTGVKAVGVEAGVNVQRLSSVMAVRTSRFLHPPSCIPAATTVFVTAILEEIVSPLSKVLLTLAL